MENKNKRKKKLLKDPLQHKLLLVIFLSAIIPAAIVTILLYYLIFNLLAWQLGIPEAIAYHLLPVAKRVTIIIVIALPVVLACIWIFSVGLSHKIVGPLYRIEQEIELRISGQEQSPIKVRQDDEFSSLVKVINKLIRKNS